MKICSIDGCDNEVLIKFRGWCGMHYARWRSHGDVLKTLYNRGPVTWEYLLSCSVVDDKTGCIEWGKSANTGYGECQYNGKVVRTHRISYELNYGPIPTGLLVCHHCDNKLCINPKHLFVGTQKDNMADMVKKNRQNHARGEAVRSSTLTTDQVLSIRKNYSGKYGEARLLMKKYDVSRSSIYSVTSGRTWRHLL